MSPARRSAASRRNPGGAVYSLADADWNGHLGTGQSATIHFTATTGIAGVLDAAKLADALWIA